MNNLQKDRSSEKGSASIKFLVIALVLVAVGNAGINYVPVAYEGANLRQEMDTAVVKGLASGPRLKPVDVVKASLQKAMYENNVPSDAFVEVKQGSGAVQAHVVYTKNVAILPFGVYNYKYDFNYVAIPTGYLLKDGKAG
jgi:Flp pilus assembly protein TadG